MEKKEYKELSLKTKILLYIVLFIIIYGVSNTSIYYAELMPFAIGIVFSLLTIKCNGYVLSIIYFLAYNLAGMTWNTFFVSLNVVLVVSIMQYLISKKSIAWKHWQIYLFSILSQVMFVILNIGDVTHNLALFVSIVLGVLFLYCSINFLNATVNRGMLGRLNLDEKICGAIVLIVFMIGMSCCRIYNINIGLILSPIIILVTIFVSSPAISIIVASLIGLSFSITMGNPYPISQFVIMTLLALSFKCNFKYFSIVSLCIGYWIFSLFFSIGFSLWECVSVLIGGVIFAFVPIKLLNKINSIYDNKTNAIVKNIIDKNKNNIINRVKELSSVFSEMDKVYRQMVRGVLDDTQAKELLKDELKSSICKSCPNVNLCYRGESNFIEHSIDTIISIGYEKGKVLLIDVPAYLTTNCIKVNSIINNLNSMIESYNEYATSVNNLDTSRVLIADQLNGVSQLLQSLSKEVDININFDNIFNGRIKEELMYKNIVCLECVVYQKNITEKIINLIVKTDTIDKFLIEKIVSKILSNRLEIISIEKSDIIGASIVTLATKSNYDIVFGCSNVNKFGKVVSGDSRSLIKIEDGKYMVAICDGMGSGEEAHNVSKLTVSLIENFYRAGYDNEIILSSINKLLSLNNEEKFSTIDLCIIDVKKNIYDFVKLGAVDGYLKRDKGECEEIKSSNLPIGVLDDIHPHITRKLINPFDMLVFISDGISDCFGGGDDLKLFVSSLDTINPQTLSEEILQEALKLSDNIPKDDMTVMCVRVFQNI